MLNLLTLPTNLLTCCCMQYVLSFRHLATLPTPYQAPDCGVERITTQHVLTSCQHHPGTVALVLTAIHAEAHAVVYTILCPNVDYNAPRYWCIVFSDAASQRAERAGSGPAARVATGTGFGED